MREPLWRVRFETAYERLAAAGIRVAPDRARASDRHVAMRTRWDALVCCVAEYAAYDMAEIDPAGSDLHGRKAQQGRSRE